MGTSFTPYYNLVKTREMGPEAKDWAVTDKNFQILSLLLKAFEQHKHTGTPGLQAPVAQPTLTEVPNNGSLSPGTVVGIRLSYVNSQGLETNATTEKDITLSPGADRPLTPIFLVLQPEGNALTGGTYIYVMTKVKGTGETVASDALPITVPYDNAYSVTLGFNAITSYTDGTTQLNVYRSSGLNSSFQLVGEITDVNATGYTDTNTSIDQTAQPPSVSTFDRTKAVTIDWTAIQPYPADAVSLNVYVTQQSGVWGTSSLLTTISLASTPPSSYTYLGSETLSPGYPYDFTQVPDSPSMIDGSQIVGGGGGGGVGTAAGAPPVGAILAYSGQGDPPLVSGAGQWVIADGRLIDTVSYSSFFAKTGHAYNGGVDPGGSMVRIPDKRGRKSVGAINMGSAAGSATVDVSHINAIRGAKGGLSAYALGSTEVGGHTHGVSITSTTESNNHLHALNTGGTSSDSIDFSHDHGPTAGGGFVVYNSDTAWNTVARGSDIALRLNGMTTVSLTHSHGHSLTGTTDGPSRTHTHNVVGNTDSGSGGTAGAHYNIDPYEADSYIVRIL